MDRSLQLQNVITVALLVITGVCASIAGGVAIVLSLGFVAYLVTFPTDLVSETQVIVLVAFASVALFSLGVYGERRAPAHALSAVGAQLVTESERPALSNIARRLSLQATTPAPDLYVAPTDTPFSLATGFTAESAKIVVSERLVSLLDDQELEAVIAHEIAHIRNKDMAVMTGVSVPLGAANRVVTLLFGGSTGVEYGYVSRADYADALVTVGLTIVLPVWMVAHVLTASLSRAREFAADRGAVALTGNPAALASALARIDERLMEAPAADLRQTEISTAAILEPHRNQTTASRLLPAAFASLLRTHPDPQTRIDHLRSLER